MRRFAPSDAFIAAMQDVATWGDVTPIVRADDGIMEFGRPIPRGEVGRGYFNLMGSKGFHAIMFKIFVGRDEKRELKADQLVKFRSLGDRLCGTDALDPFLCPRP